MTRSAANLKPVKADAKGTCFLMMPFGEPFDSYYRDIYIPAARLVGLIPTRADDLFRPTPVIDDIWAMVKKASVLVADLTGGNRNVYYELGLAHAVGKPVVLVAPDIEEIPFDLRYLRRLIYNRNHPAWGKKLKNEVSRALAEVLEDEPSAIPPTFLVPSRFVRPVEDPITSELRIIRGAITALLNAQQQKQAAGTTPVMTQEERKDLSDVVHALSQHHWESARRYQDDVFPYAQDLKRMRRP
jgi:hypothetical protein